MRLRVLGLRRSGQHAIITWIAYHFKKNRVLFFNNINPSKKIFSTENINIYKQKLKLVGNHEPFITTDVYNDYDLLIYSHEEKALHLLPGTKDCTIIVLRDPYNMTASRLKKCKEKPYFNINKEYIKLVIQYLNEGIGNTNIIQNKVIVNFNRWKLSKKYRKRLSKKLSINFSDNGYTKMTSHGAGSSFNGVINDASTLQVLERWKEFIDNKKFKEVINNHDIIKLSRKLFGKIGEF